MKKFFAFSFLFFSASILACEPVGKISFKFGDEISPDLNFPMFWSDHYYSCIGYSSLSDQTTDSLGGDYGDNRISVLTRENVVDLGLIGYFYSSIDYPFNLSLNYKMYKIYNEEFGFFQFPADNSYQTTNNHVNLDLSTLLLDFGFQHNFKNVNFMFTGQVSFYSQLNLNQDIWIKPLVNSAGQTRSSSSQPLAYSYGISLDYGAIALGFEWDILPLEYDSLVLGPDSGGFNFLKSRNETLRVTNDIYFKYSFNNYFPGAIGFNSRKVISDINGSKTFYNESYLTLDLSY